MDRRGFLQAASAVAGLTALLDGTAQAAEGTAETPSPASGDLARRIQERLGEVETRHADFLNVAPAEGRFLSVLVKMVRARNVLELGTTVGYSALWLALGLVETGGKLTTLELLPERVEIAQDLMQRAGLVERVRVRQGDAHQLVANLEGPFDLVFHDADKGGTTDYFGKIHPRLLPPGGVLVVHNAITQAASLKEYRQQIGEHREFDTFSMSASEEDGFLVSYRRRA